MMRIKENTRKKIISVLLCLAMVVSLLPGYQLITFAEADLTLISIAEADVSLSYTDSDGDGIADVTYDGTTKKPTVTVTYNSTKLDAGTDYILSYSNDKPIEPETVTITIAGTGKEGKISGSAFSTGSSQTVSYEIKQWEITPTLVYGANATLTWGETAQGEEYDNTSRSIKDLISIKSSSGGTTLDSSTYTMYITQNGVSVSEMKNAGTYNISVDFNSGYDTSGDGISAYSFDYVIPQRNITGLGLTAKISSSADLTYRGTVIEPTLSSVIVPLSGSTLSMTAGSDYTLTYGTNTYAGTAVSTYNSDDGDYDITYKLPDGTPTTDSEDFDDFEPGGTITINGVGNYTGSYTMGFTIKQLNLVTMADYITLSLSPEYLTYNKTDQRETFKAAYVTLKYTPTDGTSAQTIDTTEYSVTISESADTTNANDSILVTVAGKVSEASSEENGAGNENVINSTSTYWSIEAKDISDTTITAALEDPTETFTYTGNVHRPSVVVYDNAAVSGNSSSTKLVEGTDYKLTYADNINAGTATITITGINNYSGTRTVTFTIDAVDMSGCTVVTYPSSKADEDDDYDTFTYTGSAITYSSIAVWYNGTVLDSSGYTVTYQNNTEVGTARVTIAPTSSNTNFINTYVLVFYIVKRSMEDDELEVEDIPDQEYTGSAITPTVVVWYDDTLLTLSTDYTVAYKNNTNIGTASVIIKGTGTYTGSITVNFNIVGYSVASASVSELDDYTYTGSAIKPEPTVIYNDKTLTLNTDYTLSYSNNIKPGVATCIVTGIGQYSGTVYRYFNIICNHKYMQLSYTAPTYSRTGSQTYVCNICGQVEEETIPIKKGTITLSASTISVKPGKTAIISVSDLKDGDYLAISKTSKSSVASIYGSSGKYIVNANKAGTATMTFTTVSGAVATCTVKVEVKTTKLTLSKSKLTIKKGNSYTLKTTLKPTTSTQKVSYSSSNRKVATVSLSGRIVAKRKGKTTITVRSGTKTKTCVVTVK